MAASGNSVAIKSFQSFVVNEGLLAKVVEAVKAGEKDARTSGDVKSFEVFYKGFRQNIAIGRIFIVPAKVCDVRNTFPVALLFGTVVKELSLGEETADLITKKMGDNEFDEYSQADYQTIKDKFFMVDGKATSLVVFAPHWSNVREYVAFKYTEDDEKLSNLLRHQVFASYYNPAVSSAFDALMTTVDTHKLDITDISPKLTYPFLSENPLRAFPELVKQGNRNKGKIFLTAKTADAITQEVLDPQELNVFEALDTALTEATLPATEPMDEVADFKGPNGSNHGNAEIPEIDAIKTSIETTKEAGADIDGITAADDGTGLRTRPDYGEKGSYTQEMNEENMRIGADKKALLSRTVDHNETNCPDCKGKLDGFKTCYGVEPSDAARGVRYCGKPPASAAHKKNVVMPQDKPLDIYRSASEAPFEVPFTNVGPGTAAHAEANKAIAVEVDTISEKGEEPIGIKLDDTGLPVRTAADKLKPGQEMDGDKKKTRCSSCGAFLVKGKCPVSAKDCGRGKKKAGSEGADAALGLLNQYFDSVEHPIGLVEEALKALGSENPEASHEIHQGLAETDPEWANGFFDNARGMLMRAPKEEAKAAHVASAIAKNLMHDYEAVSTNTKLARAKREAELNKYATRRKMADVPLTEDSIWNDLMEDFGEAPQVELPGEGSSNSTESESSEGSEPEAETKTEQPKFKSKLFNKEEKKEEPKEEEKKEASAKTARPYSNIQPYLDAANAAIGVSGRGIGAYTTFTKGFGQPDDLRVGKIVNEGGGVRSEFGGTLRECCKFLEGVAQNPEKYKNASAKTATWMNRYEVEEAAHRFANDPVLGPATKFLYEFMEEVNNVSDGWHSWPLPARAASQLMDLIQSAPRGGWYDADSPSSITVEQIAKAMAPIKSFMTRRGLKAGMTMPPLVIKTKKMAKKASDAEPPTGWEDCGSCGGYHPKGFTGDCRDDKNRFPSSKTKKADDISGDIAEAKSEVEAPSTVDADIKQPVKSVEEAAKVSAEFVPDGNKYLEMQREKQKEQLKKQELSAKEKSANDISGDLSEAKSELDAGAKKELADSPEATKTVNPEHFASALGICECENDDCGHAGMCKGEATSVLRTIYGPYKMCATCAPNMPVEFLETNPKRDMEQEAIGDHIAAAGDDHDEAVEMSLGMGDLADLATNLPHQDTHEE
jgi:hypothetical protein